MANSSDHAEPLAQPSAGAVPAALALRAIEVAEELRHYAGEYFNAKWGYESEISQLRAEVATALAAGAPGPYTAPFEDLLASIWLYIDWRYVTRQLTTPQKNLLADAIDASHRRTAAGEGPAYGLSALADRWWET